MIKEWIDVVDEQMRVIGTQTRLEVHRQGLWHQTFHCWVLRRGEKGAQKIVFQLRAENKSAFPGKMDASAAGHLSAGETPLDGVREVNEELGVNVERDQLVFLGVVQWEDDRGEGEKDREFCHLYLWETTLALDEFHPDPKEVAGLFEADVSDMVDFLRGERAHLPATGFTLREKQRIVEQRLLTEEDFCPFSPEYHQYLGDALCRRTV
ncbi:NUDIX hydrolase [Marininema halotolerans]|uniref:Isopentenyldiphosphate isomerase n=1 Tax=Marininema halotolerans TaxID=1155944 RepID=A0A1I6S0H5_9BACL|nr:NUDIX domain-containing protein [Marininema halotolerans]SFS70442.1 Isopentenyldiphosphate isomerase [Marininema halotolerans]